MKKLLKQRVLPLLLSAAMVVSMNGGPVYATGSGNTADRENTVGSENTAGGLCEHHPEHTADCGYVEAQPGTPCVHEHTDECYRMEEKCVHEHTAECYPEEDVSGNDADPSNAKALAPAECSHVCSEDTGCITKVLDCMHEHDGDCGYTDGTEGSSCTYVCGICNAADSGRQENQEPKECVCAEACTEESINADCPVCGAQGADLSECKGRKDAGDEAAEKAITAWEWVDPEGMLADGGLALPGVNREKQADFDTVISMLPEEIRATFAEGEEAETVALAGWTCGTFIPDENGVWPVTGIYGFTAKLPEGYVLKEGADPLEVPVTLGGANVLAGETEKTIDGLTFRGANVSGITQMEDGQIVIGEGGDCTISGIWNGNITDTSEYDSKGAIKVAKDVSVNVTLSDVTIDVSGTTNAAAFQIADDSTGSVKVTVKGDNILKSGQYCAGLQKNGKGENIGWLRIDGEGKLSATGGEYGAGIGGGLSGAGSHIDIKGGDVTATGGTFEGELIDSSGGAGIGGGTYGEGSSITISGGTVTANGGATGAGIGGGREKAGSNITISGGNVIATGGTDGAGIGGGRSESGSNIQITGGTVNATGGTGGAGIGGGRYGEMGSGLTISGGTVIATGGEFGAGIGGGELGAGNNITISGGDVTTASNGDGAGIGGGLGGAGSGITISGGIVTATGKYGAGIGGGSGGAGSNITISGGMVTAANGSYGAGIGGAKNTGSTGNKLEGSAVVFAAHGENAADHIQGFDGGLISGVLFQGDAGKVYGNPAIAANARIKAGKTLTIESEQTLTINKGVTLTNYGTITNHGIIYNHGTVNNYGTIDGNGEIIGNQPNLTPSMAAGVVFVKNGSETDKAMIGDTVSLRAMIGASNARSRMAGPDEVVFKLGGKEIARAAVTGGMATSDQIILSAGDGWEYGKNTLTVEYGGSGNGSGLLDSTSVAELSINGITAGGITVASDDGEVGYTEGSGFTLKTNGGYRISGTWNGHITGAEDGNVKSVILVAKDVGADITLSDVTIDVSGTTYAAAFQIAYNSTGNVSLTLKGTNTLKSGQYCAGLQKNGSAKGIGRLTIGGTGKLDATGYDGAGIGGGRYGASRNITITGGTVTATGGNSGAGIGGGYMSTGRDITIDGGTVTAKSGNNGAGIGGGNRGEGSDIRINGGTVTATGGTNGAGIGGGDFGAGRIISINGGKVTAIGGSDGAGIGGGHGGEGSDITIKAGDVTATGGEYGAGIGGGAGGGGSKIIISSGTVTATGGDGDADFFGGTGIGRGGYYIENEEPDSTGNQIKGSAVVFATGGAKTDAHITGFDGGLTSCVLFEGAAGRVYDAPVISKDATIPEGKTLTIEKGQTLTVGSGYTLTNNGVINCYGTLTGIVAGTGTVYRTSRAAVTFLKDDMPVRKAVYGDTIQIKVTAQSEQAKSLSRSAARDTADFWLGETDSRIKLNESQVDVQDNSDGTVTAVLTIKLRGEDWSLDGSTEKAFRITADFGGSAGAALLESQAWADLTLKLASCSISMPDKTAAYDNTAKETDKPVITGVDGETLTNAVDRTYYTDEACSIMTNKANSGAAREGGAPVNAGTYYCKATVAAGGNYAETSGTARLTIEKSDAMLDGLQTYRDGVQTSAFLYGDTVTVKFTPKVQTADARRRAAPAINEAALFLGDQPLTEPVRASEGAECTLSYQIASGTPLEIGANTLIVKYGGSGSLNYEAGAADITLGRKALTARVDSSDASATKIYDGNPLFTGVKLTLDDAGILPGDTVTAMADGTAADANAGSDKTLLISRVYLDGTGKDFYSLANDKVSGSVAITRKDISGSGKDDAQTIVKGVAAFAEPAVKGMDGETVAGTVSYSYQGKTTYDEVVAELKTLDKGVTAEVPYTFTIAENGNYTGRITGKLSLTVVDLVISGADAAMAVKDKPVYGDSWGSILNWNKGALSATLEGKKVPGDFTLTVDDKEWNGMLLPEAGEHSWQITFTAADNNVFQKVDVRSGSLTVEKREAALTWDNLLLTYNGRKQAPAAAVSNRVGSDDVAVTVTGGQINAGSYTAQAGGLTGMAAGNYSLPSAGTAEFTIQEARAEGSVTLESTDANNNHKLDTGDTVKVNTSGVTPKGGTESYQWKKIVGGETKDLGTGKSYTLSGDDRGGKLFCTVTFGGNVEGTLESSRVEIAKEPLAGTLTLTGGTDKGDTLTVSAPANTGITEADYTVAWHRDNEVITEAGGLTYTIVREDLGKILNVIITAKETSEGFTGTLTSNELKIPATAPEAPDLTVSAEDSAVTAAWKKPFDNGSAITGYSLTVMQGDEEIPGSPFAVSADAESSRVTGLSNGTAYSFMLTAINSVGSSDSHTVSATPKRKSDGGGHNDDSGHNGDGGNSGSGNDGSASGSDDSSGNSRNNTLITPPAGQETDIPIIGEIIIGSHDADGAADISAEQMESALKQAQKNAEKNGRRENGIAASVRLPEGTTSAVLDREALDKLTGSGAKSLTLTFDGVSVSFGLNALSEIAKQSEGTLTFSVKPAALTGDAENAIGIRPSFDFILSYQKDGKTNYITNFGKDGISLAIGYTPAAGEQVGGLFAVCGDGGRAEWITRSSYDPNNRVLRFTAYHLSIYGVGYKTPPVFTDTINHLVKEDIDFAVSRGLLSGTGDTAFSPDMPITRGILVMALGRLAGIDPADYQTRSFMDVRADAPYAPYVEWAVKNNIVKGTDGSLFSPDALVTREQLAVIMAGYAGQTGGTIPAVRQENTFTDNSAISPGAAKEVRAMQRAGIIAGRDGNRFDPQDGATRAEAAAVLHRFVELGIDPAAAEGWTKNDSGHWLFYQDGRALTGWKQIGEQWYYFDEYGVMTVSRKIDGYKTGPDGAGKEKS